MECSVSIIDLERLSPDARGYHGVCIHKDKAVFVPHMNEDAGMHSTAAIVDVNNLNDVHLIDLSLYNTKVGGMINCVVVEDNVWLLPYQKNTKEYPVGYGTITILNPETIEVSFLDMDIISKTKFAPYDGSYDGRCVFLSPYKAFVDGIEVFDKRALKICKQER